MVEDKNKNSITIVHTDSGMCLTTKQFTNRQAVQAAFDGYQTSLGPYDADQLIEHLKIEHPSDPFNELFLRALSDQPNVFTWATSSSTPEGKGLKLGVTSGDSLRLAVAGYQFPDAEDQRHRDSWYIVEGSATTADGVSWSFCWQALTCNTAPLICGWLFQLADWVEGHSSDEEPPSPPWLIEPNLQFPAVTSRNGRAHLTIELDLEFLPPDIRSDRQSAGNPVVLSIQATAIELRRAAIDFAATIAPFPTNSDPSRPVSS